MKSFVKNLRVFGIVFVMLFVGVYFAYGQDDVDSSVSNQVESKSQVKKQKTRKMPPKKTPTRKMTAEKDQKIQKLDKVTVKEIVKAKPAQKEEIVIIENKSVILFHLGGYKLSAQSKEFIKRLAQNIKNIDYNKILVKGHTSAVAGNTNANMQLSKKRARVVYDELIKNGVPRKKLDYVAFGSLLPMFPNGTQSGRQQNRRAEIIIE